MSKQSVVVDGELFINQSAVLDMALNKGGQVVVTGLRLGAGEATSTKVRSAEEWVEYFSRIMGDSLLAAALDTAANHVLAEAEKFQVSTGDPYSPTIIWRRNHARDDRDPVEVDVHDGRAEYLLSGPYRLAEGSSIQVTKGKVVWCGSSVS